MAPKKPKSSVVQLDFSEAKQMVLDYLQTQYRPYSIPDLILNLHNKVNKTNMTRVLEELDKEGELVSKTYGKSVYYVCKERVIENQEEETNVKTDEIKAMKEEIKNIENELKEAQSRLSAITELPSNDEAINMAVSLKEKNEELQQKITELSDESRPKLSKEELEKNRRYTRTLEQILVQRKKIFNSFFNALRDNVETFDSLLAEIGIDMDELQEMKQLVT